jgi:hypothetical protein
LRSGPKLLADDGKDEVRVVLRHEAKLLAAVRPGPLPVMPPLPRATIA